MQRGVTTFVATLGLGLVLSACGGGGSTTATISKAEFLKQGNAICKNGNKQIEAAAEQQFPKSSGRPSQAEQVKFATQTVIPNIQHRSMRSRRSARLKATKRRSKRSPAKLRARSTKQRKNRP